MTNGKNHTVNGMTDEFEVAKVKAENTYNAAADTFEADPLSFWNRYGQRTVQRMELHNGDRVLDVCCGAGASALPAAGAVGPNGEVIAVDLAQELLKLGRAKAKAAGLHWLDFQRGDMTALEFPDDHFDGVICVFGIFFVQDMESQVAKLWRLVKPGGQFAITTWGPRIFAPAYGIWLSAVQRVHPDLYSAFNPWDRITTTEAVHKLFADAGIQTVEVTAESGSQVLQSPSDFWTIALGSGLRWIIEQMSEETSLDVKQEVVRRLAKTTVDRVETNVIYAVATRPVSSA